MTPESRKYRKRILLITTGGTIASDVSENGLIPAYGGDRLMSYVPEIIVAYDVEIFPVLNLDSSNIQPEEWKIIARAVYDKLNTGAYDGIVITHGTDTMAYTASMLSFIMRDLSTPVVLTGSQLPITDVGTDAIANLSDSFTVASSNIKGGVYIVFNGKVMLGCRASKVRTTSADAFESINFRYIGTVSDGLYILNEYFDTGNTGGLIRYDDNFDPNVFLLKLIPGTKPEFFSEFVKMGYRGIVIESFGSGGFHYIRRDMPESLAMLGENGIAAVVISQCRYESSDLLKYEVGRKTLDAGVIPGFDMTAEAAVTKLMWVLAHTSGEGIREMMLTNFCDEIIATVPSGIIKMGVRQ